MQRQILCSGGTVCINSHMCVVAGTTGTVCCSLGLLPDFNARATVPFLCEESTDDRHCTLHPSCIVLYMSKQV
jgi:hypothetical protein